jgi:hypothetical protein
MTYDVWDALAGQEAVLYTPNIDLSHRPTGVPVTMSFWFYRDSAYTANQGYASYAGSKLRVYINTTRSYTGATSLAWFSTMMDSVPIVTVKGWYQYTITIPASFNTSSNYLMFFTMSDYVNEVVIDDVTYPHFTSSLVGTITGTGSSINFNNVGTTGSGIYNVIATSANGCTTLMNGADTLTVTPAPAS